MTAPEVADHRSESLEDSPRTTLKWSTVAQSIMEGGAGFVTISSTSALHIYYLITRFPFSRMIFIVSTTAFRQPARSHPASSG